VTEDPVGSGSWSHAVVDVDVAVTVQVLVQVLVDAAVAVRSSDGLAIHHLVP
jgi:hypothetical protein